MTFLDRAVAVNGLTLHYVEWGAAHAKPLVLLHGLTSHARTWDGLASELAPRFRVLALDQRGHGDSDAAPDADYGVATMAGDLAAFVDTLGLGTLTLLGLSMGGRVAIAYAGGHAARVERLVIVDIGPEIGLLGLDRIRELMAGAPERLQSEEQAIEYARRGSPRYAESDLRHRVVHGLRRQADGTLTWKYDKAFRDMMRVGGRRDTIDLWEPLGHITCPTLLVRGVESDILSPEVAKKMLQRLPDGRLVEVEGAGHTVPGDRPVEFARVVRAFLA